MVNFDDRSRSANDAGLANKNSPAAPEITVQADHSRDLQAFKVSSLEVGGKSSFIADGLSKDTQVNLPSFVGPHQDNVMSVDAGMVRFGKSVLIFEAPVYDQLTLAVDERVPLSRESKIALTKLINNIPPGDFHIAVYSGDWDFGKERSTRVEKELERHLKERGDLVEVTKDGIKEAALPIYRYVGRDGYNNRVGIFVVGNTTSENGVHPGINRNIAPDPEMFTEARDVGLMLKVGTSVGQAQPTNEYNERFGPVDPATGHSSSTYFEHRKVGGSTGVGPTVGIKFFVEGTGATLTAELNHDFQQKLSQLSTGLDFPIGYNYLAGPISLGFRANAGLQTGVTEIWRETASSSDPTLLPGKITKGPSAALGVSGVLSAPDFFRKGLGLQGEIGIDWNDTHAAQPFTRLALTTVLPL